MSLLLLPIDSGNVTETQECGCLYNGLPRFQAVDSCILNLQLTISQSISWELMKSVGSSSHGSSFVTATTDL